jgi:hypothetical protein
MGHLRVKCSLSSGSRLHSLQIGAQRQSSLKYLTIQENPTRNTHTIWKTTKLNPRSVAKTSVKVKILTGNYTLQANRQKYNQHEVWLQI